MFAWIKIRFYPNEAHKNQVLYGNTLYSIKMLQEHHSKCIHERKNIIFFLNEKGFNIDLYFLLCFGLSIKDWNYKYFVGIL